MKDYLGEKCGLQVVKKGMIKIKEQFCTNVREKVQNKKELWPIW